MASKYTMSDATALRFVKHYQTLDDHTRMYGLIDEAIRWLRSEERFEDAPYNVPRLVGHLRNLEAGKSAERAAAEVIAYNMQRQGLDAWYQLRSERWKLKRALYTLLSFAGEELVEVYKLETEEDES